MLVLVSAPTALADLKPEECVVVYNTQVEASEPLARHYAESRRVPADRLLGIDLPDTDDMRRDQYDSVLKPTVRRFLAERAWGERIRCLVTTYGVPLRVGAYQPTPDEQARASEREEALRSTMQRIGELIATIEGRSEAAPPAPAGRIRREDIQQLQRRYESAVTARLGANKTLPNSARTEANKETLAWIYAAAGESGLIEQARERRDMLTPEAVKELTRMAQLIRHRRWKIEQRTADGSPAKEFDRALPDIEKTWGLLGLTRSLWERVRKLYGDESQAALDSELALVLHDDYAVAGWKPNPLFHGGSDGPKGEQKRTLMVSRLDAPTPEIARRMIDEAIRVEREGLQGTFYIDVRGLRRNTAYWVLDNDLENLAHLVRTKTDIPVIVDRTSDVFQPGQCPDAALYCGWYSVGNYVGAFEFVPGAVAVHIASFELRRLHGDSPLKKYWCEGLLQDGAAATLGPTAEPYLQTFPVPSKFFGLLLTGRYTLVEAFSMSLPYHSWRFSLLGDPLYRPFRNNPKLSERDLP